MEKIITNNYRGFEIKTVNPIGTNTYASVASNPDGSTVFTTYASENEDLTSMEKMQSLIDYFLKVQKVTIDNHLYGTFKNIYNA